MPLELRKVFIANFTEAPGGSLLDGADWFVLLLHYFLDRRLPLHVQPLGQLLSLLLAAGHTERGRPWSTIKIKNWPLFKLLVDRACVFHFVF